MAQSELQRQVSRNQNDITALYDLTTEINQTVLGIDDRLTAVDNRLTAVDDRLTAVATVQQHHDRRLVELQRSVDRLEKTQGSLGVQMAEMLALVRGGPRSRSGPEDRQADVQHDQAAQGRVEPGR